MSMITEGRRLTFMRALRGMLTAPFQGSKRDRGSMLLEAIVSLGLLSALTLGYTMTSTSAGITQRNAINDSIATQVTRDALETARATPWASIGTTARPANGLVGSTESFVTGALPASRTVTSRGLEVTVETAVQWVTETSATGYGSKNVVISVTWMDNLGDPRTTRNRIESAKLTPGIGEAAPSSVRRGSEGSVPSPPDMPVIWSTSSTGTNMQVAWLAVPTASSYLVDRRINNGAWVTSNITALSYTYIGNPGDTVDLRVRASSSSGKSLFSNTITRTLS